MSRYFKKIFFVLVFLLLKSYIFSSTINLDFRFPPPKIEKIGKYFVINMEGLSNFGNPGEPILPVKTVNVLLPANEVVANINVVPEGKTIIKGKFTIMPGQKPVPLSKAKWIPLSPNPEIYNSSSTFPGRIYHPLKIQKFRGYKILPINIYPVQFIPQQESIFYFKNIRITVNTKEMEILQLPGKLYRGLLKDRILLRKKIENFNAIKTYAGIPHPLKNSPIDEEGPYDYIIITSENLSDSFQPLINHKIKRGLNAKIITTEWIFSNYQGIDEPEKIRNFIIDAYNNWHIDYVLLGGDSEIIPIRYAYGYVIDSEEGEYIENIPCDMYYGCLDGRWDGDEDRIYGEPEDSVDLIAEVYVGRAPVETHEEVENFVNKIIWYENNFGAAYQKKFLLVGEKLYDDPETWGGDYKDVIANLIPPSYQTTKYYDRDGTFNGNGQLVIDAINNGVHLINHMGHSDYWMVSYVGDWEFYDISENSDDIKNNENFCFFYSQGCYAGAFDEGGFPGATEECVGENFIRSKYGAFAVVMNSRYGWFEPADIENSPSQQFDEEFWDAFFNEGILNLGKINQDSKEDNLGILQDDTTGAYRWCCYELNLFGDPETQIGGSVTREGKIFFNKKKYKDGDKLKLTVMDMDLNTDHESIDATTISITTSQGDSENLSIQETDINSGILKGEINLKEGNPNPENGIIECGDGDTIIATYIDEDDGSGESFTRTAETTADFTPPLISNVQVINIQDNNATITWQTDEPSTSKIYYGVDIPPVLTVENIQPVTSHSITLNNLDESTTYYFYIESTDEGGNTSQDNNGGGYYSFVTKKVITIFFDDMESEEGNWEVSYQSSENPSNNWHITEYFSYSGTHCWHFCEEEWSDEDKQWIFTYYPGVEQMHGYLISPEIDLRNYSNAYLSFYHLLSIGGTENTWDWAKVEISVNGVDWYDLWLAEDTGGFWKEKRIDLTPYTGNIIRIRFHFYCDWYIIAEVYPGWFIDDFKVKYLKGIISNSISGQISYRGDLMGRIYMGAFDNPEFEGSAVNGAEIETPGSYTIPNLPEGTYYIGAYMDVDEDKERDNEEPQGFYDINNDGTADPVVLSSDATGIDITLTRTDDDTEGPNLGNLNITPSTPTVYDNIEISINVSDPSGIFDDGTHPTIYYGLNSNINPDNPETYEGTTDMIVSEGVATGTIPAPDDRSLEGQRGYIIVRVWDNDNEIPGDMSFTDSSVGSVIFTDDDTEGPSFSNPSVTPSSPTDSDTFTFHINITDQSGIKDNTSDDASVYVMWATDSNFTQNVGRSDMDEGDSWVSDTPAGPFISGTVYWKVYAEDNDNSPEGRWSDIYQVNITDDDTIAPSIGQLQFNPSSPTISEDVTVTVEVSDASGIWDDENHPSLYYSWTPGIDPNNPTTYENRIDMSVSGGIATGTVPAPGGENEEKTCYVKIRVFDNDFDNGRSADRSFADSKEAHFTYADDDTEGPEINNINFDSEVSAGEEIEITANISDLNTGASGVYSATLYYGYGEPPYENAIEGIGPGGSGDGQWTFVIHSQSQYSGDVLKFWIEAYDNDYDNGDSEDRGKTINDNNEEYYSILITNIPPDKPENISPENGEIDVPLEVYLKANEFSDSDQNDTQISSEWQVFLSDQLETEIPVFQRTINLTDITRNPSLQFNQIKIPWGTLQPSTEYKWRVRYKDTYGEEWSEWSGFTYFTTISQDYELDEQVADEVELAQLQDIYQVDTGIKVINDTTVGVKTDTGNIKMVKNIDPNNLPDEDKPSNLPFGLFAIRIEGLAPTEKTITVSFYFPNNYTGRKWYKYDSVYGWYEYENATFEYDATNGYTRVDIILEDGGEGDADGKENGVIVDPSGPTIPPSQPGGGGGGCFIATAAYGSPLSKQVSILEKFRDKYLLTNTLGRAFVRFYYIHSPKMAEFIRRHIWAKILTRIFLYPLVLISCVLLNYLSLLIGTLSIIIVSLVFKNLKKKVIS